MANPTPAVPDQRVNLDNLTVECEGLQINGKRMLVNQGAKIAALATAAVDTDDTYTDEALNTALNIIVTKVNAILTRMEDLGLNADT
jgi:hypothetical protein